MNARDAGWDAKFFRLAEQVGAWSKDTSVGVGAVIVGEGNDIRALGYNGFPRGVDDEKPERHLRPEKYLWTEHAERNAIFNAARSGTPLVGTRMYVPWFPCAPCARAIVQVGIAELIGVEPDWGDPKWGHDWVVARELLTEGGVSLRWRDSEPR